MPSADLVAKNMKVTTTGRLDVSGQRGFRKYGNTTVSVILDRANRLCDPGLGKVSWSYWPL